MRIAIVVPPWLPVPPRSYGGTEAVVDTLARGLKAAGHDVLLATTGDSTCPVQRVWTYERALGTNRRGTAAEIKHVIRSYEQILAWGPDVIHDNTLVGPSLAQAQGHPVVMTNHGPFDGDASELYASIADRVAVIAISHRQAALAGDVPIAAVIHHGVEVDRYPPGDGSGGFALFLGRMSPQKGVHRAIEVARGAASPCGSRRRCARDRSGGTSATSWSHSSATGPSTSARRGPNRSCVCSGARRVC
jgi:glycosyltransferase involved in cell wall biosynthesis